MPKSASTALKTFLVSTQNAVKAGMYTITLSGGTVRRFTDADVGFTAGGFYFAPFAGIKDSGVSQSRGVKVDTLQITFTADDRHVINGVPFIPFVRKNGLDGALIKVEKAYALDWETLTTMGPIGTVVRFFGRYSEVLDGGRTEVTVQAASWTELLNTSFPADVYSGSCRNTVFSSRCGAPRVAFEATGTIGAGEDRTDLHFPTSLATQAGYFDQGAILFLTGPNAGLRRTIRSQGVDGRISLSLPLPAAPGAGDSFKAWPGCDLSKGLGGCAKFNNLPGFRGQPFIPVPETAV